tara:strand:+ start:186 stop:1487 length:1302 start_codon:yes stop_codon:yes gene_type:complete
MKKESNKNFNFLLTASAFSNLADGIAAFAYPWLFSLITRDPLLISLTVFLTTLPQLIFVLFAGVIADKFNRKSILIFTRVLQVLLTLSFVFLIYFHLDSIPKSVPTVEPEFNGKFLLITFFYIGAFIFGMLEVTRDNAAQSFLPQVVSKDELPKSNGRLFGFELIANNFLGAPIAGFLIGLSLVTPFIFATFILLLSVFFITAIKGNFERTEKSDGNQTTINLIKEGVSWLSNQILLRRLAIYTGIANLFAAMQYPVWILFGQEILGLDSVQFAFLSYGLAVGGLVGSLLAEKINKRIGESKTLLISIALFGIGGFVSFITSNPFVVAAAFGVTSFGTVLWNVQAVSIRQALIPDKLMGRVNSVYRLLALGLTPLGALFGGFIVKITENSFSREFAIRFPFLIFGIFMFILFLTAPKLLSQKLIDKTKNIPLD